MRAVNEVIEQELTWVQPPALKRQYELHAGEEVVATLEWRSVLGTFATGTNADGSWTFKRIGFLKPRVTIREMDSDQDFGVFRPNSTYAGTLTLSTGQTFRWNNKSISQSDFSWTLEDGREVMGFQAKRELQRITRTESHLTINTSTLDQVEARQLGLLALFGWYMVLLTQYDVSNGDITGSTAGAVL